MKHLIQIAGDKGVIKSDNSNQAEDMSMPKYIRFQLLTIIGHNMSVTCVIIIKLRWRGTKINVDSHCFGSRCG